MKNSDNFPPPSVFGLPSKYVSWRPNQIRAIESASDRERRIVMQVCPTGFGKSASYVASALLMGGRAVILTSTKGLQTQLMLDFKQLGMVDMRGKNSYLCRFVEGLTTCEDAPCSVGFQCPYRDKGCNYYDALNTAMRSRLVVTNYSFWFAIHEYSKGLGDVDFLICDEAHDAPEEIAKFLTIEFDKTDQHLERYLPMVRYGSLGQWVRWAHSSTSELEEELLEMADRIKDGEIQHIKRANKLKRLLAQIETIKNIQTESDWVVEDNDVLVRFSPIWGKRKASSLLCRNIPHILLTSAFICDKTASLLDLPQSSYIKIDYPHSFQTEHRIVCHIPSLQMNYRVTIEELKMIWLPIIDSIVKKRLDRKGIIHTASYDRAEWVLTNSDQRLIMMGHGKREVEKVVREFKNATAPKALVSPSVTTGYDFPGDECRYQVIGKLSYPDLSSKLIEARVKSDPEYPSYIATQKLIQASGRGVRSEDDWCETFVVDDAVVGLMRRHPEFFPQWFKDAFRSRVTSGFPPKLEA